MHSTGIFDISKKKNNEYFGGDSTVTQAGEKKIFWYTHTKNIL